ncbi:hypothetical protein BN7874_298 [Phage NCTB]|jgi:hypothetical protein|nr:hypothetical protein BN7874_298 [Phage NCTB]
MLREVATGNKIYQKTFPTEGQHIAVLDIDDFIYPCTQVMLDHLNQAFDKQVKLDDLTELNVGKWFEEISEANTFRHFLLSYNYMNVVPVYDYVAPMVEKFRRAGVYVAFVTARGFHPEGYRNTHQLLTDNNIYFDCLATTRIGQSKLDFVLDYICDEVHIVGEDSASVIEDFTSTFDVQILKSERCWNSHIESHGTIHQHHTVDEVLAEVDKVLRNLEVNV